MEARVMSQELEPSGNREREIFLQALEKSTPAERATFVGVACRGDDALRAAVEALLANTDDPLLDQVAEAARPSLSIPLTEKPGDLIGRYKLLQQIGEGGMGVVYMAEQGEPVRRKVALKIIKLGMDTRQVVARFEAERQALALMDHSNIAKVLDGGATESGRPYFVMELVQGVPITEFCDKNHLSAEDRIKLFIPVCQAIQSAHQKGIIHRDLKPSNVLVTLHDGVPVPKVIDFGVAKAINQKLTEKTLFTNFATMIGTPAYMSPEQAEMSGLDIDTRSDIYSLGVLLYELLTGTTPFSEKRLRSVAYSEVQRIIVEEEPERPSTRLKKTIAAASAADERPKSPFRIPHSAIDPDLDWIVMKCLEKDRSRRYEAANGLASDIQRHLRNEPIAARPPRAGYRFRKLVRRNKLQVAAATFALFVLVVASLVSSWQAVRAIKAERVARAESLKAGTAERAAREQAAKAMQSEKMAMEQAKIARDQSERAKAVQDFLAENLLGVNFLAGTMPDPDATSFEATRAMVEKAARKLEGKFANQPLTEAEIRMTLVLAFDGFGDTARMAVQAEKALEIRQRLLGPADSDTLVAVAALAQAKFQMGREHEAKKLLQDAMTVARSATNGLSLGGAWIVCTYGEFVLDRGHGPEALPYLTEGLAGLKRILDPKHLWIKYVIYNIAYATEGPGRLQEAESLWVEGIRECEKDLGPDHRVTAEFEFGLARFLVGLKRSRDAVPLLERYVRLSEQKLGKDHRLTLDARSWLGQAYEQLGRIEDTAKVYTDLYPRWLKQLPYVNGARTLCPEIARFFLRQQRPEDAKAIYEPLRAFYEANPPEEASDFDVFIEATAATKGSDAVEAIYRARLASQPQNANLLRERANFFARRARWKEAAADASQATRFEPTNHLHYHMLAPLLVAGEDLGGYRELCQRILARFAQVKDPNAAERMARDCLILPSSGADLESISKMADQAVAAGSTHPDWIYFQFAKGLAEYRQGRFASAREWMQQVVAQPGRDSNRDVEGYLVLAMAHFQLKQTDQARVAFGQAIETVETKLPPLVSGDLGDGWNDWVIRQALMREAKALIEGAPSKGSGGTTP
jgi:tetratricopeptide (TPR) repeat protein